MSESKEEDALMALNDPPPNAGRFDNDVELGVYDDDDNDDGMEDMDEELQEEQGEEKEQDKEEKMNLPSEVTDPKVMEFLRILDEYRVKCEDEGNYEEAERASKQLDNLRKQEMKRQVKALKARQISERQDIQIAHNMQFAEFNAAWDKYMQEFDQMAQQYIRQMTERHAQELREFQEDQHKKMVEKPPKFSKELLEWRRRQHMLAKQKNYAEAQKIKNIANMMEAKERSKIDGDWNNTFGAKEGKCRARQQAELNALLKRIDVRRKEHLAQRNLDSKRLLQRNRNVQAVLTSKQAVEGRISKGEIQNRLTRPRKGVIGSQQVVPYKNGGESKTKVGPQSPVTSGSSTFLTS